MKDTEIKDITTLGGRIHSKHIKRESLCIIIYIRVSVHSLVVSNKLLKSLYAGPKEMLVLFLFVLDLRLLRDNHAEIRDITTLRSTLEQSYAEACTANISKVKASVYSYAYVFPLL